MYTEEDVREIILKCFEEYCGGCCDACEYGEYDDCFDEYERRKMNLIPFRKEVVE